MPKGSINPNTNKVLRRDTWIGLTSTNASSINPYVIDVAYINDNITNYYQIFKNFSNITSFDILEGKDTSMVTNMRNMFENCTSIEYLNLSNFDTSKVINTVGMFYNCSVLKDLDVSHFNTVNVTDMNGMFYGCSSLKSLNLSSFNTPKVTSMPNMFSSCTSLISLNLSSFDTSKVTTMRTMFSYCRSLVNLDLSSFDTSNVADMNGMFYICPKLNYVTVSSKFFYTTCTIPFESNHMLGLNADNSDNGWLAHIADTAPEITDGQSRTIQLHTNLKSKSWAQPYLQILQDKGYTIS